MLLEVVPDAYKTFQGKLKDERGGTVSVAFSDPDTDDGEVEAGVSIFDTCINRIEKKMIYFIKGKVYLYFSKNTLFILRLHFTACM